MRYIFLLLTHLLLVSAFAQERVKLDENTIVKDSTGAVLPYSVWQSLLMQRDFSLRRENGENGSPVFVLYRLTEKQKEERLSKMPKPRESTFFTTGEKISLFNVKDIQGNKINLKDAKGKIIVLNFWFIDCKPCRQEIPDLNNLVAQFENNPDIIFVAIALDSRSDLKDFLKTTPFNYHIVDDGKYFADKYGIRMYPTHVIVDGEGKVRFHTSGLAMNTVEWLKKSIDALLPQQAKAVAAD
jgi:peroxiredoxin